MKRLWNDIEIICNLIAAENVPKVEPGLPNGAEAGAGAAPPAAPVKPEPALELGTAPGLKLDQVRNLRLYNMMFFIRYLSVSNVWARKV